MLGIELEEKKTEKKGIRKIRVVEEEIRISFRISFTKYVYRCFRYKSRVSLGIESVIAVATYSDVVHYSVTFALRM